MTLTKPLRPRWCTDDAGAKKVTWLELFFDLVFVAAVAQVASPLHHHYTPGEVFRFVVLFVLIWWAWTGHATFATRFAGDDAAQRSLTVLQMFVVAAMAANATDPLDSRSSAGFAAAYAVMRLILVVQYFRARHVPAAATLSRRHLTGHGVAGAMWLASAFVPAPTRFVLWTAALAIDLATPWFTVNHAVEAPPDGEHLPERYGLFTIILLGEVIVGVMHGMQSQEYWTPVAASAAFGGLLLAFSLWWLYFEALDIVRERRVTSRRDAVRFHLWIFAHLPFYIGVVSAGVGARRLIELEPGGLAALDLGLLSGGLVLTGLSLILLRTTVGTSSHSHVVPPGRARNLQPA